MDKFNRQAGKSTPRLDPRGKYLETAFNSIADGVLIADEEMSIVDLNPAAELLTGYQREELLGRKCTEIFHGRVCGVSCVISSSVGPEHISGHDEVKLVQKDGHVRLVRLSTSPLREGHAFTGVVVVFRDVTELVDLRERLAERYHFHNLIGKDQRMQEVYDLIQSIAETDSTVLIRGETGTGKELVAQAIHFLSHRAERPFVKVNCSALSEGILESELFGHVKGAFTGAIRDKIGRFELAQGGTLFLDEIGDVTPAVQMKLLRAIEQKEIERVGESRSRQIDVRVVAATNRDLEALKDQGHFREDLYYRLKVVPVHLPPLRERRGDIPLLVDHFIEKFNQKMGRAIEGIIPEALSLLLEYPWPGNVRELENAIEYAFIKAKNKSISLRDFPWEVRQPQGREETRAREELTEPEALRRLLTQTGWRISESSRIMGIHRSTLWRKIRHYGIKPK